MSRLRLLSCCFGMAVLSSTAEGQVRRQTPLPPYPYVVEELVVGGSVPLACSLTMPAASAGRASVPAAILLSVAGPNDRDQTHSGHKPFLVLADHLARNGIAALRCDDRGVGGSRGKGPASMDELGADAAAMIDALRARQTIGCIGVIGNSEGAVVGARLAAEEPERVAFLVLLGGVGVRGSDVIRARMLAQAGLMGMTEARTSELIAPFDSLTAAVTAAGGIGITALKQTRPDVYDRLSRIASSPAVADPMLPANPQERVELFASAWYHAQLTVDGGKILERVRAPVLALTGSKDLVNLPGQNLPAIRSALERGRNADYVVRELPDLNHVFQTAVTGTMAEYRALEESFAPAALAAIVAWIGPRASTCSVRSDDRPVHDTA